jgi:TetR/AcrR family transcriptional regulator, cholesterol catabolism regulator
MARASRRGSAPGSDAISIEVIQQEATRLFAERTYPAVGIRDIADAVGLLPGSLYVHIRSKEELLFHIVRDGIQRYLDAIAPAVQVEAPASVRLQDAMAAYLAIAAEHQQQTRVAFHQWTYLQGDQRAEVVALRQSYERLFTDIVHAGVESSDFRRPRSQRLAVLTIVGALNAAGEWFDPSGSMGVEDVASDLADTALRGLSANGQDPATT